MKTFTSLTYSRLSGSSCCAGFPLVRASGSYFLIVGHGLSRGAASVVEHRPTGAGEHGLSCLRRVESSPTRGSTCFPAMAGGYLSAAPSGKSKTTAFNLTWRTHTCRWSKLLARKHILLMCKLLGLKIWCSGSPSYLFLICNC